jgi:DNA-binding SARP family transcriptional activator/TolB-like protein
MISLTLLGGASLEGTAGAIRGPAAQRHRIALLALLSTSRTVSRDKLQAYLWPERDAGAARKLLNQAVHHLRGALGEGAILSVGDELRLGTDAVECDVISFEAGLAAGDLDRAVDLYAGPFLDGFHLSDALEFERWVDRERQRLAGSYARALEGLAEAAEARGDAPSAVHWWSARAAHDPYDSRVAVSLMRALVAGGNHAGALRHAAVHRELLREELGTDAGPEVLALAEHLREDPGAGLDARTIRQGGAGEPRTDPHPPPRDALGAPGGAVEERARDRPRSSGVVLRFMLIPALGAAAILGGAVWLASWRAPSLHPHRVAVATFENRTGDPSLDPIGPMAADLIRDGLLHTGLVEVASGSAPSAMVASAGSEGVRGLAQETGAGLVVSGAYYLAGDSLRFQAELTDSRRGRVLSTLAASEAEAADPSTAIESLRQQALGALALVIDGQLFRLAEQRIPLPTYDAYRAYRVGLELSVERRWAEAIEPLERAIALDSTYPAPQLRLAVVHMNLGATAVADSVLRELDRSREDWGAYDRAYLAMLMTWLEDDQAARFEATKRLAAMSDWAVPQAGVEAVRLNHPREAIEILGRVDPARAEFARTRSWYWIALADAHHMLGDHRRELQVSRRARALVPDDPVHLFLEARALAALGRLGAVEETVDARSSLSSRRDPDAGAMMVAVGHELRVHGHPAAARAMYARAIEWYRSRPADERTRYRPDLARALLFHEEWQAARALFEQLALEEPDNTDVQGALGMLAARAGDLEAAGRSADRLADRMGPFSWTSPSPEWRTRSNPTYWRACIAAQLHRPTEATALLARAFEEAVWYGHHPHTDPCLDPLRDYPPFQELMRPRG